MTATSFAVVAFIVSGSAVLVGLGLLRRLFAAGGSTWAVGRLLLEEAARERGILLSLFLFVGCLCGLPLVLGSDYPLSYRVQSYLTYAQTIAALFLSLLTILFASRHVAGELSEGPALVLFTKPLSPVSYVLGKFLALAFLNLLLVAVATGVVFATVRVHLWAQPADQAVRDRLASQVLVAREAVAPTQPPELAEQVDARFATLDPEWIAEHGGANVVLADLERRVELSWRSVPLGASRSFGFDGLTPAVRKGAATGLQLRYRLYASPRPPDGLIVLSINVNGQALEIVGAANRVEVTELPASAVDASGHLELTVERVTSQSGEEIALAFVGSDGLEVLYPVGGFAANLSRGMTVRWLRLTCLGMLATLASTFLSFSVAAVFSLAGLLIATTSPFVLRAVARGGGNGNAHSGHDHAGHGNPGQGHDSLGSGENPLYEHLVEPVMGAVARVLGEYSRVDVTERLVDGRWIPGAEVVQQALWLGLAWSGVCGLLAVYLLRCREMARVQV